MKVKLLKKDILWWFVAMPIVLSIIGYFGGLFAGGNFGRSPDSRRVADLRTTSEALELYRKKFGSYPVVSEEDSWGALIEKLKQADIGISTLSLDPEYPDKKYSYGSSEDGAHYVIRALLDDPKHPWLENDIDGMIYGVNCGDSRNLQGEKDYCIGKYR